MELMIRDGDYVADGGSGLCRVSGQEALLQRILYRLTAHRGSFPFWETLGSRLWQLGKLPAAARQSAAKQYVTEALAEERDVQVESVTLTERDGRALLLAELTRKGEPISVSVELRL